MSNTCLSRPKIINLWQSSMAINLQISSFSKAFHLLSPLSMVSLEWVTLSSTQHRGPIDRLSCTNIRTPPGDLNHLPVHLEAVRVLTPPWTNANEFGSSSLTLDSGARSPCQWSIGRPNCRMEFQCEFQHHLWSASTPPDYVLLLTLRAAQRWARYDHQVACS